MMKRVVLSAVCLSLLVLGSAGQVEAFGLNLGDDVTLDVDVGLKYGFAKRMDEQDDKLISNINEDDGNRSFDRHDTFMNKVSASTGTKIDSASMPSLVTSAKFCVMKVGTPPIETAAGSWKSSMSA